jgi:hypothetical protein
VACGFDLGQQLFKVVARAEQVEVVVFRNSARSSGYLKESAPWASFNSFTARDAYPIRENS